ncbi:MAG: isoprenylcysteine carboxylmethyltransferase family protein [Planctomycetota bacterium]|nr:isoprenylcysteine carboxylmethyltransferase family protein [Planctomycetota bacterium]
MWFRRLFMGCTVILNGFVVSLPLALHTMWNWGSHDTLQAQPTMLPAAVFVASCSAMCTGELFATSGNAEQFGQFGIYQYASLAGSLVLLLLQWGSLSEFLLTGNDCGTPNIVVGSAFVLAGCTLRSKAIRTLAAGFCSKETPRYLITDGIYSKLRHPSETGLLLASIGIPWITGAWRTAVVALPITLAMSWVRMRLEEKYLRAQFGDVYAGYCKRVGMWLPRFGVE